MLLRLKEKLDLPSPPPELYDPRKVDEERDMIENAIKKTVHGNRQSNIEKIKKEHKMKY